MEYADNSREVQPCFSGILNKLLKNATDSIIISNYLMQIFYIISMQGVQNPLKKNLFYFSLICNTFSTLYRIPLSVCCTSQTHNLQEQVYLVTHTAIHTKLAVSVL
jgi:hypothetical protein